MIAKIIKAALVQLQEAVFEVPLFEILNGLPVSVLDNNWEHIFVSIHVDVSYSTKHILYY